MTRRKRKDGYVTKDRFEELLGRTLRSREEVEYAAVLEQPLMFDLADLAVIKALDAEDMLRGISRFTACNEAPPCGGCDSCMDLQSRYYAECARKAKEGK